MDQQQTIPFAKDLEQARQDSGEALDRLLRSCLNYLHWLAFRSLPERLNGRTTHDEVVQATLLKAWRHFGQFAGHCLEQFLGWLARILRGVIQNLVRFHCERSKRAGAREQPLDDWAEQQAVAPDSASPGYCLEQQELAAALSSALEKLPQQSREVVQLHFFQERTFPEIASLLGLTAEGGADALPACCARAARLPDVSRGGVSRECGSRKKARILCRF